MKILQIIQRKQLRGAEIFACQLSDELIKLGHRVDVLYLFGEDNRELEYDLNFIALHANERNRFWDFSAYKRLANIIKKEGYDIVQANAADTLKYSALSKKLYGWNSKLIFRNANKMSDFIRSIPHKLLNTFFLNQADYIISVSENCRQDIIKLYPRAGKISDTGTIGTYDFSDVSKAETDDEQPIWINVGSLVPEKNHEFLITIFSEYLKRNDKGTLWIVGDGKLRSQLEKHAESLGIESKVNFLGYRKDVISLIKASDVMVMPSKIEGLPGVILEALSCGKPVVAAAVGGIPEVIIDEETGYCIVEYNISNYIEKIDLVLSDQDYYSKLSKNGIDQIKDDFLMNMIGNEFEDIYLRLLN